MRNLGESQPRDLYHVMAISNNQAWLFPELAESFPLEDKKAAGKRVVDKLLKVRRSLDVGELTFLDQVNFCIEDIRCRTRLTDTQREEIVLYAIERQGASTIKEISEDTRLHIDLVKQIVANLRESGRLRQPRKHIPGSDKPNFMTKSVRAGVPEAD